MPLDDESRASFPPLVIENPDREIRRPFVSDFSYIDEPRVVVLTAMVLLLIAAVFGIVFRFDGLGDRQLSTLEFYFATSVTSIINHGLPRLPGGGYYHPGLASQYVVAAIAALFGEGSLVYRFPGALLTLGTVCLTYVFVRPRLGRIVACCVCSALLLSSWEIEFARLARPYAMLQFVALLLLVSMDRCWWTGPVWNRYIPHGLTVVVALTSEFPPVMAALLFLPLAVPDNFLKTQPEKVRYGAVTSIVFLVVLALGRADFRTLGTSAPLPAGVEPDVRAWIELPFLPFWSSGGLAVLAPLVVLGFLLCVATMHKADRLRRLRFRLDGVLAVLLVLAALLHSLILVAGLGGWLCVQMVRRCGFSRRLLTQYASLAAIAISAVIVLAWVVMALMTDQWVADASSVLGYESLLGAVRITFLGWPRLYAHVFAPWSNSFPVLAVAITIACGVELASLLSKPRIDIARSPATSLLIIVVAMGVFSGGGFDSSFFIYPLVLAVVAAGIVRGAQFIVSFFGSRWAPASFPLVAAVFLSIFGASRDFNPTHLANLRTEEVEYRTGQFEQFAPIWSVRDDVMSAGLFLEKSRRESNLSSLTIVQGIPAASRYLTAPYAVYYSRDDMRFARVSRAGGSRDVWSEQLLLSTDAEVRDSCEENERLWIIRKIDDDRDFCIDVWPAVYAQSLYRSRDNRVEVLRLDRSAS